MQKARFYVKKSKTGEIIASGDDVVSAVKDVRIKDIEHSLELVDRIRGRTWHMQYDCLINGLVLTEPRGEPGYISLKE